MHPADFVERLGQIQRRKNSLVCVGLDPDPARIPPHLLKGSTTADAVIAFNEAVIDATAPSACAFKLNLAFFEALGTDGWRALTATLRAVPEDVVTIADGKRGDIGNSARFYAAACFDDLGFHSCTTSGYMGRDSVSPFLEYEGTGVFLLARTSNPGGADFQELVCAGRPLYEHVVRAACTWDDDSPGTIGFVVGATDVVALERIRTIAPHAPLLIPGIGAQGGDADAVLKAASGGSGPLLINSSRTIMYASGGLDYAAAAGRAAAELRDRLQQ